MSRKHIRVAACAGVLLVIILCLAFFFPSSEHIPLAQWGAALQAAGTRGLALFFLLGVLATSIGLPRQSVGFVAGLAYGILPGLLVSLSAAIAGCYLTVITSRRFLSGFVASRYPGAVAKLDSLLSNDLFIKILILRLQPFGTNLLTNVCIGFTAVRLPQFLIASAVGFIPQMLVFVMLGAGVRVGSDAQVVLSAVLLAISVILAWVLLRRHRSRDTQET